MSLSLFLACAWGIIANIMAMLPARDNHWRRAYILIATGIPIVLLVGWQLGGWMALIVLLAMASILRWPLRYLLRWITARFRR
ncbi:DUF2484 family protein [Citreicella sp. C3M06]|uniref:DUF2484 family protein n=1 Tax=Citreicella sp. C3M06 TaxID=2841564 RepID=UPI001C09EA41|nr:DUF2484 family protein [Citreicella sp. C3M06]MBU2960183.1 DUF2484 family protein [Citreicella sp. C3M06]